MERTDEQYMEQATKGDMDAFATLFHRHQAQLVAFLTRFLGERALAEDIAQDAFLNVWKKRETFNPRQSFRVYLYVVAKNLALNERASAHTRRTVSLDVPPEQRVKATAFLVEPVASGPASDPENAAMQSQLRRAVRNALGELPEEQRLCVLMHEYDQFSYPEIGRILGCSSVAARVLGFRGRKRLKQLLAPYLQDEQEINKQRPKNTHEKIQS